MNLVEKVLARASGAPLIDPLMSSNTIRSRESAVSGAAGGTSVSSP